MSIDCRIGRAIAAAFSKAGASQLLLIDANGKACQATAAEIQDFAPTSCTVRSYEVDLTSSGAEQSLNNILQVPYLVLLPYLCAPKPFVRGPGWVFENLTRLVTLACPKQDAGGRCDCLVNNAGIMGWSPLQKFTLASWKRVFDVNVHTQFLCTHVFLPPMLRQKAGTIINLASG